MIALKHITDGASKTMLIVEKYVPSNLYDGKSWGDNFAWTQGDSWEGIRFAHRPEVDGKPAEGRQPENDAALTEFVDDTRGA